MNRIILMGLMLFFSCILYCQTISRIKHFNTSNSLIPSDEILCISIDSNNTKWIGTTNGLAKFDGKTWTTYNIGNGLLSNKVTAIAFDKNNNVWIIDSVLSKYDGKTWEHFTELKFPYITNGSKHLIVDSTGIKWLVKNNNTLISFDGTSYTEHKTFPTDIRSIKCFENEIWIADQSKVYKYSNGVLKDCSFDKNTNKQIVLNINDLQIDSKGDKWLLGNYFLGVGNDAWTYEMHLFQLKGEDDYSEIILPKIDSYGLKIELEKETKWIGVLWYGLMKLSKDTCEFYNHSKDSLLTNIVGIIAVDKLGNKWLAAPNDWYHMGVSVFNEKGVILTNIKDIDYIGSSYKLSQNYPNPFNSTTKISFTIPKHAHVLLKLFDILGREISILINKELNSGEYEIEFDGKDLSSGVYFYTLTADSFIDTKKLLLMK